MVFHSSLYDFLRPEIQKKANHNFLVITYNRKYTTENTVFFTKKCGKNLQVKNRGIMFVLESKIP